MAADPSVPADAAVSTAVLPPTITAATASTLPAYPLESPVITIPLAGTAASRSAEFSGMAWYNDWLVLLPQYPTFATSGEEGLLFALPKADILAFLDGAMTGSLTPIEIPFTGGNLGRVLPGFEGFEAITFVGEQAFLTVETSPGKMLGYLVAGQMQPDLSAFVLDTTQTMPIEPQADSSNHTDETIVWVDGRLVTIYEVNGRAITPSPVAHLFDPLLQPLGTVPFPSIEYRVTDATAVDENGRFWVINYFYPGDTSQKPASDPIAQQAGQGNTHSQYNQVERLLELQYTAQGIQLTDTPPIQLTLIPDARNWEGVVRLNERGFLLVTDKFPETILAFVPAP
ncbi:MAG: hypothetical protein Kow0080_11510 [Candidatus Promineifilaceae bacterium]